jgi:hypothetical protein
MHVAHRVDGVSYPVVADPEVQSPARRRVVKPR